MAALLEERGAVVIDADSVGHELLNDPGSVIESWRGLGRASSRQRAKRSVVIADDRSQGAGAIVFADPTAHGEIWRPLFIRDADLFHAAIERENRMAAGQRPSRRARCGDPARGRLGRSVRSDRFCRRPA